MRLFSTIILGCLLVCSLGTANPKGHSKAKLQARAQVLFLSCVGVVALGHYVPKAFDLWKRDAAFQEFAETNDEVTAEQEERKASLQRPFPPNTTDVTLEVFLDETTLAKSVGTWIDFLLTTGRNSELVHVINEYRAHPPLADTWTEIYGPVTPHEVADFKNRKDPRLLRFFKSALIQEHHREPAASPGVLLLRPVRAGLQYRQEPVSRSVILEIWNSKYRRESPLNRVLFRYFLALEKQPEKIEGFLTRFRLIESSEAEARRLDRLPSSLQEILERARENLGAMLSDSGSFHASFDRARMLPGQRGWRYQNLADYLSILIRIESTMASGDEGATVGEVLEKRLGINLSDVIPSDD